jgi:3-hydroxyisobutyrate dehydrogenase
MNPNIGWIGLGRMGYRMVQRVLHAGHGVRIWNRTRSKAEPLVNEGAQLVDRPQDLASVDVLFTMLSTGKDLKAVLFGSDGLMREGRQAPRIIVDCSSIGADESAEIRAKLVDCGVQFLCAPVSGNPGCVTAGKLSCVVSGPQAAYEQVSNLLAAFAVRGVSYVGDGELARMCKIAHNVFLAVVIENLIEITLLAQKAGVPRHAFLKFMNNSALGSIFTQYKSPALVNLEFEATFTPSLLLKDADLGLSAARRLGVAMPVTAATREVLQTHISSAGLRPDSAEYLGQDFATLIETLARSAGMKLESENVPMPTGLE